jgi:hypothetical protein
MNADFVMPRNWLTNSSMHLPRMKISRDYNWLRVSIGIGAALLNDWQNGHGEAGDGMIGTIPGGFRRGADGREHGAMRRR